MGGGPFFVESEISPFKANYSWLHPVLVNSRGYSQRGEKEVILPPPQNSNLHKDSFKAGVQPLGIPVDECTNKPLFTAGAQPNNSARSDTVDQVEPLKPLEPLEPLLPIPRPSVSDEHAGQVSACAGIILSQDEAAVRIQSVFRGHVVRQMKPLQLLKVVADVRVQVEQVEEKVKAINSGGAVSDVRDSERLRWSETLMALLLRLDAVQSSCEIVRTMRKSVTKKVVMLLDKIDSLEWNATQTPHNELERAEVTESNYLADDISSEGKPGVVTDLKSQQDFNSSQNSVESLEVVKSEDLQNASHQKDSGSSDITCGACDNNADSHSEKVQETDNNLPEADGVLMETVDREKTSFDKEPTFAQSLVLRASMPEDLRDTITQLVLQNEALKSSLEEEAKKRTSLSELLSRQSEIVGKLKSRVEFLEQRLVDMDLANQRSECFAIPKQNLVDLWNTSLGDKCQMPTLDPSTGGKQNIENMHPLLYGKSNDVLGRNKNVHQAQDHLQSYFNSSKQEKANDDYIQLENSEYSPEPLTARQLSFLLNYLKNLHYVPSKS